MTVNIVIMIQRAFLDSEGEPGLKSDVPRKQFGCHGHIMLKMVDIVKAKRGRRRYH
ncbi:hypothetical protein D3C81_2336530 [compost metagenome]